MQHREITESLAQEIFLILKEECHYRDSSGSEGFVMTVATVRDGNPVKHVCHEFRFIGALGFGGKFRNNGNCNNTPHVDCYPEHQTPERLEMIEKANVRLAELFARKSTAQIRTN